MEVPNRVGGLQEQGEVMQINIQKEMHVTEELIFKEEAHRAHRLGIHVRKVTHHNLLLTKKKSDRSPPP